MGAGHPRTKRPERPHQGAMIWARLPLRLTAKLERIAEKSKRDHCDVLRLAVSHLVAFPGAYKNLETPNLKQRRKRMYFRVSRDFRLTLSDYAWRERLTRVAWIEQIINRFFKLVSQPKIVAFLARGQDLRNRIEENIKNEAAPHPVDP